MFALCHLADRTVAMRKKCFSVLLFILLLVATLHGSSVLLLWDYPAEDMPVTSFKVYWSQTLVTPVTNWAVLTNVQSTNRVWLTVQPGRQFFFVTATNVWGESDPSNVLRLPGNPKDISINLQLLQLIR